MISLDRILCSPCPATLREHFCAVSFSGFLLSIFFYSWASCNLNFQRLIDHFLAQVLRWLLWCPSSHLNKYSSIPITVYFRRYLRAEFHSWGRKQPSSYPSRDEHAEWRHIYKTSFQEIWKIVGWQQLSELTRTNSRKNTRCSALYWKYKGTISRRRIGGVWRVSIVDGRVQKSLVSHASFNHWSIHSWNDRYAVSIRRTWSRGSKCFSMSTRTL